jgi:hypothetical protein
LRLHAQLLDRHPLSTPVEVVRWLGALQAQDYLSSLWAIGLRLPGTTEADIERAIADREIVRTWPMRGTIHYVAAEDARWMLELLTPRVVARSAGLYKQFELDEAIFARCRALLSNALQGGRQLVRKEMYRVLEEGGVATGGSRGLHLLGRLALEGLVCFGPREGKQPTFVLLAEWVPKPRVLDRNDALGILTQRFFMSHGPATVQDFTWWSGLAVADAQAGLERVASLLTYEKMDGRTYWFSPALCAVEAVLRVAHLLPSFDEYFVAYKDRSTVVHPACAHIASSEKILGLTLIMDGRMIGTWKRTRKKNGVEIVLEPSAPLSKSESCAVSAAGERYRKFVAVPDNAFAS